MTLFAFSAAPAGVQAPRAIAAFPAAYPAAGAAVHAAPLRRESAPELYEAVLDQIDQALVVCDLDGRVLFLNHEAEADLAHAGTLRLADGRLEADTAAERTGLEAALRGAVLQGRRRLVVVGDGAERRFITVTPLQAQADAPVRAMVLLGRRQLCSALGLELLAGAYGLTHAERRVLAGLLAERTAREIATEAGVAMSTIRTQIGTIREKLGARSIDALLCRLAQVPPTRSALRCGRNPRADGATAGSAGTGYPLAA